MDSVFKTEPKPPKRLCSLFPLTFCLGNKVLCCSQKPALGLYIGHQSPPSQMGCSSDPVHQCLDFLSSEGALDVCRCFPLDEPTPCKQAWRQVPPQTHISKVPSYVTNLTLAAPVDGTCIPRVKLKCIQLTHLQQVIFGGGGGVLQHENFPFSFYLKLYQAMLLKHF